MRKGRGPLALLAGSLDGLRGPIPPAPDRVEIATVNLALRPITRVEPTARLSWLR